MPRFSADIEPNMLSGIMRTHGHATVRSRSLAQNVAKQAEPDTADPDYVDTCVVYQGGRVRRGPAARMRIPEGRFLPGMIDWYHNHWCEQRAMDEVERTCPWARLIVGPRLEGGSATSVVHSALCGRADWNDGQIVPTILVGTCGMSEADYLSTVRHEIWHILEGTLRPRAVQRCEIASILSRSLMPARPAR